VARVPREGVKVSAWARTVVPPHRVEVEDLQGNKQFVSDAGDGFDEKLLKYIPAETIAFLVPAAAALGTTRSGWLIAVLGVGAVGSLGWLWYNAQSLPPEKQPRLHSYLLAFLAFCLWAVGTAPNVASLVGVDEAVASVLLGIAVFLIPLLDGIIPLLGALITRLWRRRPT